MRPSSLFVFPQYGEDRNSGDVEYEEWPFIETIFFVKPVLKIPKPRFKLKYYRDPGYKWVIYGLILHARDALPLNKDTMPFLIEYLMAAPAFEWHRMSQRFLEMQ